MTQRYTLWVALSPSTCPRWPRTCFTGVEAAALVFAFLVTGVEILLKNSGGGFVPDTQKSGCLDGGHFANTSAFSSAQALTSSAGSFEPAALTCGKIQFRRNGKVCDAVTSAAFCTFT